MTTARDGDMLCRLQYSTPLALKVPRIARMGSAPRGALYCSSSYSADVLRKLSVAAERLRISRGDEEESDT